jgi:glycosyltransferase involved in cell wall biosynthesis
MSILIGHPTGNPNSHHAALAHHEMHRLEAFCVPWMPSPAELALLKRIPGMGSYASRLDRRSFPPLFDAPLIEGRGGELWRMARRALLGRFADEGIANEANDWLMRTMARECARPQVTAVHAYEDCSLWSFEEARRLGKACIYDMPIGYQPAWQAVRSGLLAKYGNWLPEEGAGEERQARHAQKQREMELADLVLVPCTFVRTTIERYVDKPIVVAPYAVDVARWQAPEPRMAGGPLRFIYAGHCSLRKGTPVLLQAWRAAGLADATLELVGPWMLSEARKHDLPPGVTWSGPVSSGELGARFRAADVFVFPSFFEGFGLVILEAMASGLPVITTDATAGPDIVDANCGSILPAGDVEALAGLLDSYGKAHDRLPAMKRAARAKAEGCNWEAYRRRVTEAVSHLA